MKIYLNDAGDPTVGIFAKTYEVDCPFERDTADPEDLELFRKDIQGLFRSYDAIVKGVYDFELEELEQQEQINLNSARDDA